MAEEARVKGGEMRGGEEHGGSNATITLPLRHKTAAEAGR